MAPRGNTQPSLLEPNIRGASLWESQIVKELLLGRALHEESYAHPCMDLCADHRADPHVNPCANPYHPDTDTCADPFADPYASQQ
eukprot:12322174-Alexandrium_andersonii.AAC.1